MAGGVPSGEMAAARRLLVVYRGPSMLPTLREPQLMVIEPYDGRPIRRGDIILFTVPDQELQVVHRVVGVSGDALLTCGDNNRYPDQAPVRRQQIVGRVTAVWEGRRRRAIRGGRLGLVQAWLVRRRQRFFAVLARPVRLAYVFSVWVGLQRALPQCLRLRLLSFAGDDGMRHYLTFAGRIVGRYDPERRAWQVRYPYLFLVDPEAVDAAVAPR